MFKLIVVAACVAIVAGHGTVHEPPARQTRWRYDSSAIPNYADTSLNCGGYSVSTNLV